MALSGSGNSWRRVILIQLVIVAGLVGWLKIYLPRMQRAKAASEAAECERRIETLYQFLVVDDLNRQIEAPDASGEKHAHPQNLRSTPSVREVEQALGLPGMVTGDFRGGQHLTWTGTNHRLEASFSGGRLYCLRREDLRTGHGIMVFESSWHWRPF
jgi:hypothetical protein